MPQRVDTDIAGVGRVDAQVVVVRAGAGVERVLVAAGERARAFVVGDAARAHQARAGGEIVELPTVGEEGRFGRVAVEVVAVTVVVERRSDEVAVVEVLLDTRVELALEDLARALELVVAGVGTGDVGAGAVGAHLAGLEHAERATEVVIAE